MRWYQTNGTYVSVHLVEEADVGPSRSCSRVLRVDKGRGAGREEEGRGEDSRRGNQWTRGIGVERRDVNGRVVERREGQ